MGDRPEHVGRPRSSRQRYRRFVEDYHHPPPPPIAHPAQHPKPAAPTVNRDRPPPPPGQRYGRLVENYNPRRLDEIADAAKHPKPAAETVNGDGPPAPADAKQQRRLRRRQYFREYLHWLRPHRYAVVGVFVLAL